MSEEFYRIKRLPPYVFAEVNRLKAKYRAEGMDIIDFGMGNPQALVRGGPPALRTPSAPP
jgi:aspartate/methionine/tyrosine aminotransferase